MAKTQGSRRPPGRNPVIAVRVAPPLHEEITAAAKAAERTMSAEVEMLLRQALDARKRFPDSVVARTIEAAVLAYVVAGERYARDIAGLSDPQSWSTDFGSRREAAVAACQSLISSV